MLYVDPPSECTLEWLPGPADFLEALKAQGYDPDKPTAPLSATEQQQQQQMLAEAVPAARLHVLALLLRLLRMVFSEQVPAGFFACKLLL